MVQATTEQLEMVAWLVAAAGDGSPIVRSEVAVALARFASLHSPAFQVRPWFVPSAACSRHCCCPASSHDPAFEQLASCALIGAYIAAHFAAHIAAKPDAASCMTVRHDRLGFKSLLCRPRPTRCVAMIAESCELRLEERAARQASRRRRPVMDRSVMDAHCQLAVA